MKIFTALKKPRTRPLRSSNGLIRKPSNQGRADSLRGDNDSDEKEAPPVRATA
jgi:hypothetical protein